MRRSYRLDPDPAVDGRQTHFPLPFLLFDHLPLLSDILPSRICFAEGACLAAVISFGIDDTHRYSPWQRRDALSLRRRNLKRLTVVFTCVTLALVATLLPQQRSRAAAQLMRSQLVFAELSQRETRWP